MASPQVSKNPRPTWQARALRITGALIGLAGLGLLLGTLSVAVLGGGSLMASSGFVLVVFVSALACLMACAGWALARGDEPQRSLVPPWALVLSGALILASILGTWFFAWHHGVRLHSGGLFMLAALGFYWLRSGLRGITGTNT